MLHCDGRPGLPEQRLQTGTKFGCGAALCGACTAHLNGQAIRSSVTPISAAAGQKITTIEAVTAGADKVGKAVHAAWVKHVVAQCGYCQSGQIMSAAAFLKSVPRGKRPTLPKRWPEERPHHAIRTHHLRVAPPPAGACQPRPPRHRRS